ncbi:MAG: cytochrome c3 family protein [Dermatophilaceae bacterium]
MTRMNGRSARRAWAFGAAATFVVSLAVAFLTLFSSAPADAVTAGVGTTVPRYALHPVTAAPSASVPKALAASIGPTPHGPYTKVADECATCHRVHTGKNKNLLKSASPQSNLCLTCHDGTGANTDVKAQYTDSAVPQNDPTNRAYYRHDALVATSHTSAGLNEFGGVSNRHSECGDCHNPHKANATDSTPTATGWTASGRLAGISGVSVVNSTTPGLAPTYTFLDGKTLATSITREYQLCFKCHSGFTTLPDNTGFTPSKYLLDKGAELNPNNPSYHPVEAPGKNTTAKMAVSLTGTSPYKQWTFTPGSTIRCTNCHTSSTKYNLAVPPPAGSDLPPHTSQYRGILLQNYRDRLLKPGGAASVDPDVAYADADFALCFMCHSNTPFATDGGGTDRTNFFLHGYHTSALNRDPSAPASIDTPGAGRGNALCAECHFRIHSTTYKDGTQTISGSRLVNFAPDVQPNSNYGTIKWTSNGTGHGSCTLTCHGKQHDSMWARY